MHRNCYDRLQRIFTQGFTVLDVAEPLFLLDAGERAETAAHQMQERGILHAGVLDAGSLSGFVNADGLTQGSVGEHVRSFNERPVLRDSAPLGEGIVALETFDVVFVEMLSRPAGAFTRSQLQKAPVRMWLFGSITLVEMAITRAVRNFFPGDRWMAVLPEGRLLKAMTLWKERQRREQNVAVLDCLQMADKVLILLKNEEARKELGFASRRAAERMFQGLQSLRNNLAHAQDIVSYDWDSILVIAKHMDNILDLIRDDRLKPSESSSVA